jgi:hypothetical protein
MLGNLTTSPVPVSSVSLRRIERGVKALLRDNSRTFETDRRLVVARIDLNTLSMRLGEGKSSPLSVIPIGHLLAG